MQRIECLVNASAVSLDVPAALTADVPVGEVGITVEAASKHFDDDDDCVVRTLLARVPTPVWTPVTFE